MSDFFKELKNKTIRTTSPELDEKILHLVKVKTEHQKNRKKVQWTWGAGLVATLALTIILVNNKQSDKDEFWNENPEMLTHMQEIEFYLETEDLLEEDWQEVGVKS